MLDLAREGRHRHALALRVVIARAQAREQFQFLCEVLNPRDVPIEQEPEPIVGARPFERDRALQQRDRALQRAEGLAQLVADHAVESLEARGLLGDRLRVGADERVDGGLQEDADAVVEPPDQIEAGRRVGLQAQARGLHPARTP